MSVLMIESFEMLLSDFDTEQKCQDHLAALRWNGEPTCPYCQSDRVNELKGKTKRYKCYGCRKQFGVRVGTIFHDSKISLRKWFFAFISFDSFGKNSHQLARDLKVTQKSAWFILDRIEKVYSCKPPTIEKSSN